MVNIAMIRESNARFGKQHHEGLVCVFAGATSGIGLATLEKMTTLLHSSTFYVLGRTPERYQNLLGELRQLAPTNKIITSAEKKVDYLCMSPGGMPFQGAVYTDEGLETCFAVSYYSRLRLASNLLPLLNQAVQPRVLSILNGTKEKKINEEDIGLEKKWRIPAVVAHTTLLTSLTFDHLAANDVQKHITLIHGTPGFVNSGRGGVVYPSRKDGIFWRAVIFLFQRVSSWIIRNFGMAVKESGERHAFLLTSDTIRSGSWRTNRLSDVIPDNQVLKDYQQRRWGEKIWDFTLSVWEKALVRGNIS